MSVVGIDLTKTLQVRNLVYGSVPLLGSLSPAILDCMWGGRHPVQHSRSRPCRTLQNVVDHVVLMKRETACDAWSVGSHRVVEPVVLVRSMPAMSRSSADAHVVKQ